MPLELQAVERAADVEKPRERRRRWEVRAQRLLVDVVTLLAEALAEKGHVPPVHGHVLHRGSRSLRLQRAQLLEVPLLALLAGGLDVTEELLDGLGRAGHAPAEDEVREARKVVEAGDLAPQRNGFVEDLEIARRAAVQVPDVIAAPRALGLGIRHERIEVGVVEREEIPSLGIARLS